MRTLSRAARHATRLQIALVSAGLCLALLAVAVPFTAHWTHAAPILSRPTIRLSVTSGPPTTVFTVSGSGFKAHAIVDLYWETTNEAAVMTDHRGSFSGVQLQVPRVAVPGTYWVSAVERHNRRGAQAPFLVQTDWPMFHANLERTGLNPYENVLSPSTVSGLSLAWSYRTGGPITSSPAVANGVVYIGSANNKLYAFNATTGVFLWSFTAGTHPDILITSSPAVANDVVYVGSTDHNLYALNATTGSLLWKFGPTGENIDSSPAVYGNVVYVGSNDGKLYALNATTGSLLWSFLTSYGSVFSSPTVAKGVVYTSSGNGEYALNATTGSLLWSYRVGGGMVASVSVMNGTVYVSNGAGVDALNATSGVLLWSYHTSGGYSSTSVANGTVYVGTGAGVDALNATSGVLLWSYTGSTFISSPAVADGVVYIGSFDDKLYALNATTGSLLWSYSTGSEVRSSPAVANGVVYVGSEDSNMYAFALPNPPVPPGRPSLGTLKPNLKFPPTTGCTGYLVPSPGRMWRRSGGGVNS